MSVHFSNLYGIFKNSSYHVSKEKTSAQRQKRKKPLLGSAPFGLLKSCSIAAAAAEGFGGLFLRKAIVDGFGPGGRQNGIQVLLKEISKVQVPLVVQAAGHHSAVPKNAQLVPQAIAEVGGGILRCGQVRPVEFIPRLQKNPVAQGGTPSAGKPIAREAPVQRIQNLPVPFIRAAVVPKPVYHDFLTLCRLPECNAVRKIAFKGHSQVVGFKGVEGDIDFVQGWGVQKDILPGREQCAVGGQDDFEARFCR